MENMQENTQNTSNNPSPGSSCSLGGTCCKPDFKWILERSKNVLTDPKGVWESIQNDNHTIADIYKKYALAILAVPAIAGIVAGIIYGVISGPFIKDLIVQYVITAAMLYIGALALQLLAPKFEGNTTVPSTLKLLVYPQAAAAAAAIICILPLGGLRHLIQLAFAIYALYIVFQGITPLTGVRQEKKLWYFLSFIGIMFLFGLVLVGIGIM